MNLETLKKLRLLIPGIISVVIGYYYYSIISGKPLKDFELSEFSIPMVLALIIGTIYYLTNLRYLVTNFSHKRIDLNIKNNIFQLYTGQVSDNQRQYLFKNNRLKNVFYHIIDNDSSLSQKKNNVYFNGLIWTSTADFFIISLFSSLIFLISIPIFKEQKNDLLIAGFILIFISLISFGFHILAFLRHINLSNEQIEYIETHNINQVNTKINEIIQSSNAE